MPSPRSKRKRGIYTEQSVGETIELSVVTSDGSVILTGFVDARCYDRRLHQGMEKWLDRMDPPVQLTVVQGGG